MCCGEIGDTWDRKDKLEKELPGRRKREVSWME